MGEQAGGTDLPPSHLQGWAHQRNRILLLFFLLYFSDIQQIPKHKSESHKFQSLVFWGPAGELEQGNEQE